MTCIRSVTIISISSDSNSVPIRIQGHRITKIIDRCFPINIRAKLIPAASIPGIDPYMTCIISTTIICICSDSNSVPIRIQGHRITGIIARCFPINIRAKLIPAVSIPGVDPCMTCIISTTIISICSDSDSVPIRIQGHRSTRIVVCSFPVNVRAKLFLSI